MYTAVYLRFGREREKTEYITEFIEMDVQYLEDLDLFNYTMRESELGKIFYIQSYDSNYDGPYGIYLVAVTKDDEKAKEKAKELLVETAMEILRKRMDDDWTTYQLLEQRKIKERKVEWKRGSEE